MKNIKKIISAIKNIKKDIKAEIVVNNLIESNILEDNDYIIRNEGQFCRNYRKDILGTEFRTFLMKDFFEFQLSRDGLYDVLPQGVTHKSYRERYGLSVERMLLEYKENKQQEKAARDFFAPFENEFFKFGVSIEHFQMNFLKKINTNEVPNFFYELWNIPQDFPTFLVSKLIRLLPYCHKIVGNIETSVIILSQLLNQHITIKSEEFVTYQKEGICARLNNSFSLGVDFIIGQSYEDYTKHFTLEITTENQDFIDFLPNGKIEKFIKMYCEYFFPLDVDIIIKPIPSEQITQIELTHSKSNFLGYNTQI